MTWWCTVTCCMFDSQQQIILFLVSHLGHLISNLSALLVGIIRKSFNGEHANQTSNYFQLVIPISKLLRSILDRTARLPNLISEDKWLSDFPISDYSVMKRQNMLRNVSKSIKNSFDNDKIRTWGLLRT